MAHKFVEDAREVVKTGAIVKVKVLEVDVARKRISLSMKLDAASGPRREHRDSREPVRSRPGEGGRSSYAQPARRSSAQDSAPSAMASAFAKLQQRGR